ncbi:hypothetical protein C206_20611 [Pseudomonas putida TRO1]|jgi:hypothetical protein|uniref:Uncharacterized protein n=1 Tax=Pseudomonas putida TRO1 TaxID=1227924 RepID=A0AAD2W8T7_PSEPU|nr:hypothetical protein C206_20611 [Pseudomonas putida TRO1]
MPRVVAVAVAVAVVAAAVVMAVAADMAVETAPDMAVAWEGIVEAGRALEVITLERRPAIMG